MAFARGYVRVVAALTVAFGLVSLLWPASMADPAGFGPLAPSAATDVRATYGGLQLGLGLYLLWASADVSRLRGALVLLVATVGCVGASRALGMLADGSANGFHLFGISVEITMTLLSAWVLRRLPAAGAPA
jgi:hypothetical protein